jgi:hypothetical protein
MADKQLMDYFKFDSDDLYANQNGRFTDSQRVRMIELDKRRRKTGMTFGIILGVVAIIGPIIAIVSGIGNPSPAFIIPFGIGFGVVWPLIWGGIGYVMIKSSLKKVEFKVASVQGRANIVARESRSTDSDGHTSTTIYHELHVGGVTFGVERSVADVIFQGDEYIVYYVEATKDILSVEPVGKKKK